MAIAQLLAQILAAQYGRDVRQSIHDAIGECYDDVSTAKTLATDATNSANTAATLANTKAGLADTAATNANDNIIDSAAFIGNDMVFTKVNNTTVTIVNAKTEIKGDKGDNGVSAYTQATIGGYTGLLEDFYSDLASLQGLGDLLASL